MSTQVILEFPDELPDEILHDSEILTEGKRIIVLEMLRKGVISRDKAASLLEIKQEKLFDLIARYRLSGIKGENSEEPTTATAGAWKDLLDCQAFEEEIYESRNHTRPEVRL